MIFSGERVEGMRQGHEAMRLGRGRSRGEGFRGSGRETWREEACGNSTGFGSILRGEARRGLRRLCAVRSIPGWQGRSGTERDRSEPEAERFNSSEDKVPFQFEGK